jgi:hypothetical protein
LIWSYARVSVRPKDKPSSTQNAACPKCGNKQIVYSEKINFDYNRTTPATKLNANATVCVRIFATPAQALHEK